jgi:gas vesicle protein
MSWKRNKDHNKQGAGRILIGILIGSVIGATVGLLTAPTTGAELRRRITGASMEAREKIKTARGNVESRARELVEEVSDNAKEVRKSVTQRRRAVAGGE